MVTFHFALDTVMQLKVEEREDLIEILNKRKALEWRKETADYYKEVKKEIKEGMYQGKTSNEVISELHDYLKYND